MSKLFEKCIRPLTALSVSTVLFLCLTQVTAGKDPERPSDSLTLIDIDGSKITFDLARLKKMPQVTEKECICVGEHVGFIGIFDYAGVRLAELLNEARAFQSCSDYKKRNVYLVLRGTDGYQVVVTWNELLQTAPGTRVLIAIERDGKPIPAAKGQFRSLFPGDKYFGRSVMCLETIEIHCADGVVERDKDS